METDKIQLPSKIGSATGSNRQGGASTEPPICMSSRGDQKGGRESMYDYYGVPYIKNF